MIRNRLGNMSDSGNSNPASYNMSSSQKEFQNYYYSQASSANSSTTSVNLAPQPSYSRLVVSQLVAKIIFLG